MDEMRLGEIEARFADIIWANAPVTTADLIKKSAEALGWKRTTTYTVLKRLCERGIFKTENGVVDALMSREDFYLAQGEKYVDGAFGGSLPAFLAAFTKCKKLSDGEIDEIQKMIDDYRAKRGESS